MKKIALILFVILVGCSSKTNNEKDNIPNDISSTSHPVQTIEMDNNESLDELVSKEFSCSLESQFNFLPNKFDSSFFGSEQYIYIYLDNDDIEMGISETGGGFLYGKYYKVENNIYAYYGDVPDYSKVPFELYHKPEQFDETILGYFRIENDVLYPMDTEKNELNFSCEKIKYE